MWNIKIWMATSLMRSNVWDHSATDIGPAVSGMIAFRTYFNLWLVCQQNFHSSLSIPLVWLISFYGHFPPYMRFCVPLWDMIARVDCLHERCRFIRWSFPLNFGVRFCGLFCICFVSLNCARESGEKMELSGHILSDKSKSIQSPLNSSCLCFLNIP
jgi:hypothetical protein